MTYVTFLAQTVRHFLPDASDASSRAFTLQSQPAANRSRPLRTPPDVVSVYRTNPTQWTQCVHGQPAANRSRTVRASGKIVSVYTALVTNVAFIVMPVTLCFWRIFVKLQVIKIENYCCSIEPCMLLCLKNNIVACEALMQFAEPNNARMCVTVFF